MNKNSLEIKKSHRNEMGFVSAAETLIVVITVGVMSSMAALALSYAPASQLSDFKKLPEGISKVIIEEAKDNPTFTGIGTGNSEIDITNLVSSKKSR